MKLEEKVMKNYLNDAMDICFLKADEYVICNDPHSNCKVRATICGKCYQDPDLASEQLYADVSNFFFLDDKKLTSGNLILRYDNDNKYEHEMRTDYIGPSRAWACEYLEGNLTTVSEKIGDFLLVSRTIGGHVFWPAHQVNRQNTINQVRGGRGIYDRFDITLAELKQYFATQIECGKGQEQNKSLYYDKLYDAFKRYDWFFKIYGTFDNYIEKMKLDMFLNDNEVFSLVDSDVENKIYESIDTKSYEPRNYEQYIKNCKILIEERSRKILENK